MPNANAPEPVLLDKATFHRRAYAVYATIDHGLQFDYATINGTQFKALR